MKTLFSLVTHGNKGAEVVETLKTYVEFHFVREQ